jgi:RNA-binding protein
MEPLKGFQKQFLKGLAHAKKPVIFVGKNGLTPDVVKALGKSLDDHELIKVKFIDFKEKDRKLELCALMEQQTGAVRLGMTGHVAIFYREQPDPEKRKVLVPKK